MTDSTISKKQLVMINRSGPAFNLSEISKAHAELDLGGAPRRIEDRQLTLPERIAFIIDITIHKNQPGSHNATIQD